MSATASSTTFPTDADVQRAWNAMTKAFDENERIRVVLRNVVGPWMDRGERIDKPSLEVIGRLAKYIDDTENSLHGIRRDLDQIQADAREVMSMLDETPVTS